MGADTRMDMGTDAMRMDTRMRMCMDMREDMGIDSCIDGRDSNPYLLLLCNRYLFYVLIIYHLLLIVVSTGETRIHHAHVHTRATIDLRVCSIVGRTEGTGRTCVGSVWTY